ncbi:MAG: SOS response-associated peptidase [Bacteroidia bacterium]
MCYTINARATVQQLNKRYNANNETPELHQLLYKLSGFHAKTTRIKDYRKLPVLTATDTKSFKYMQWGLIPFWTPQEKSKEFAINNLNAKGETIFEKKSFAPSLKGKRCIIPITGFFESRTCNKENYPYFIHLKDADIFSLAGIYDTWKDKETGSIINSFSIITTQANALMAKIHNKQLRMPVILTLEKEQQWIQSEISEKEITELIQPLDELLMVAHTVDKKVNNSKIDSNFPDVTNVVTYPELGLF